MCTRLCVRTVRLKSGLRGPEGGPEVVLLLYTSASKLRSGVLESNTYLILDFLSPSENSGSILLRKRVSSFDYRSTIFK